MTMATFNLNNEMVDMRKDIKRSKLRTISKLVRQVRTLRNKKGNESQLLKNKRRAERLVDELDMVKDLKSDDVFKVLLNSNTKLATQDLMIQNLDLKQRAIIRINSASFIQERISKIKGKISDFHHARSKKPLSNVFNAIDRVIENKDSKEPLKVDSETTSTNNVHFTKSHCDTAKTVEITDISDSKETTDVVPQIKNELIIDNETTKTKFEDQEQSGKSCDEGKKENASMEEHILTDDEEENLVEDENDHVDQSSDDRENIEPLKEEIIIGTSSEGYQIVLPSMPTFHFKNSVPEESNTFKLDGADGVEDVTDILPNVGENFHSDNDSDVGSDIELEQLEQQNKNEDQEVKKDMFFIDKKGFSTRKSHSHSVDKTSKSKESSDEDTMNQVKSCFVESLASVSHQRTKGKNRMSQRARKQLHKKQAFERNNNNQSKIPGKTNSKPNENSSSLSSKCAEPTAMHPSWEASRKRKEQQSQITQFQGKRVCFDDSD